MKLTLRMAATLAVPFFMFGCDNGESSSPAPLTEEEKIALGYDFAERLSVFGDDLTELEPILEDAASTLYDDLSAIDEQCLADFNDQTLRALREVSDYVASYATVPSTVVIDGYIYEIKDLDWDLVPTTGSTNNGLEFSYDRNNLLLSVEMNQFLSGYAGCSANYELNGQFNVLLPQATTEDYKFILEFQDASIRDNQQNSLSFSEGLFEIPADSMDYAIDYLQTNSDRWYYASFEATELTLNMQNQVSVSGDGSFSFDLYALELGDVLYEMNDLLEIIDSNNSSIFTMFSIDGVITSVSGVAIDAVVDLSFLFDIGYFEDSGETGGEGNGIYATDGKQYNSQLLMDVSLDLSSLTNEFADAGLDFSLLTDFVWIDAETNYYELYGNSYYYAGEEVLVNVDFVLDGELLLTIDGETFGYGYGVTFDYDAAGEQVSSTEEYYEVDYYLSDATNTEVDVRMQMYMDSSFDFDTNELTMGEIIVDGSAVASVIQEMDTGVIKAEFIDGSVVQL